MRVFVFSLCIRSVMESVVCGLIFRFGLESMKCLGSESWVRMVLISDVMWVVECF